MRQQALHEVHLETTFQGPRNLTVAVELSAMQGYAKQRSYNFVYTWPSIDGCRLSVLREVMVNVRVFRFV